MKGLRSILGDSVQQAGGPRRVEEQGCLDLWPTIVGEAVADATRAERLRDGILFVMAKTSVWAYELTFAKEKIIGLMNDRLGRPLIRDIRFKVGPLTSAYPLPNGNETGEGTPSEKKKAEPATEEALTERSRTLVEQAIATITDERLRERTRLVLVREARKREQKQRQGWKECQRCGTLHPESTKFCPLCRLRIKT
jgi:hypothetical protein